MNQLFFGDNLDVLCGLPAPGQVHSCEPAGDHGAPSVKHVGREHPPDSMMVGPAGCSSASRPLNECEPQQIAYRPTDAR